MLFSSGGVASGLGILLVVPVGAMALLADSRDAFLLAAARHAGAARATDRRSRHRCGPASRLSPPPGILGGIVFLVALLAWPVRERLRETEAHGPPPAGRSRESRAALAVHRAAPAREHRGGRSREPHPPDQRNGGAACSATAAPIRARCSARRRRSLLYLLETWRQRTADAGAPSQTFVSADGGHVIQPHFASLGGTGPGAGDGVPRGHRAARRARSSSPSSRRSDAVGAASRTRSAIRSAR